MENGEFELGQCHGCNKYTALKNGRCIECNKNLGGFEAFQDIFKDSKFDFNEFLKKQQEN